MTHQGGLADLEASATAADPSLYPAAVRVFGLSLPVDWNKNQDLLSMLDLICLADTSYMVRLRANMPCGETVRVPAEEGEPSVYRVKRGKPSVYRVRRGKTSVYRVRKILPGQTQENWI